MSKPRVSTPSTTALPPSVDPLAEPLRFELDWRLALSAELTAPWGLDLPRIPGCIAIHVITSGNCILEWRGRGVTHKPASVDVAARDESYLDGDPDAPVTPLTDVPVQLITDRYERRRWRRSELRQLLRRSI